MELQLRGLVVILASLVALVESTGPTASISVAIARPFALADVDVLPESFGLWEQLPPCRATSPMTFDLVLVYSQSLDEAPQAQASIEAVKRMVADGEPWTSCISGVFGIGVDIDAAEDIYSLELQKSDANWVNGPNRQFERSIRAMQVAGYDLMYYMEMDSVPVQAYWFESLVHSIFSEGTEFAILGSKYRGYKWESFVEDLPWALVNHINGNALYNLSHPVLEALVQQLEDEAETPANSIPYDYRMMQMIEETTTGVVPSFFAWTGDNYTFSREKLAFMSQFDLSALVRETPLIGNYASTNLLPTMIGHEEVVVHGARMFGPWDSAKLGDITLVVGDWIPLASQAMLLSLDEKKHPFTEVKVIIPDHEDFGELFVTSIPVFFSSREGVSDSADLCNTHVTTPWSALSNSYFELRDDVGIMVRDSKPVISFEPATFESCFSNKACSREMKLARLFVQDFNIIFEDFNFIYHTETLKEYCQLLDSLEESTLNHFPSATSYAAYLKATGVLESIYELSDRTKYGTRHMFHERAHSSLDSVRTPHANYARKLRVLKKCKNANDVYACPPKKNQGGGGGGGGGAGGGGGGGGAGGGGGGGKKKKDSAKRHRHRRN